MSDQHGQIVIGPTPSGRIRLKEAARRLDVHAETLRRWAKDGMVTYWAVGRGRYMEFDPKDIAALDYSFRREPNKAGD